MLARAVVLRIRLRENPLGMRYRAKAYSVDPRQHFRSITDLTIRGKAALSQAGVEYCAAPYATGKIEVLASTTDAIIFRYHRAAIPEQSGEVIICKQNPKAYWFDDYQEIMEVISLGEG